MLVARRTIEILGALVCRTRCASTVRTSVPISIVDTLLGVAGSKPCGQTCSELPTAVPTATGRAIGGAGNGCATVPKLRADIWRVGADEGQDAVGFPNGWLETGAACGVLCRGEKKDACLNIVGEDARAEVTSRARLPPSRIIDNEGVDDLLGMTVVDTGGVVAPAALVTLPAPPPLTGGGAAIEGE